MPASASDITRSISPGSTEYGDRGALTQGIQQVLGGGGGGQGPLPSQTASAGIAPTPSDPLGALLSGSVDPGTSDYVNSGLPFGPGASPGPVRGTTTKEERLRQIALGAKSPVLRQLARNLLRRHARGV